LKERATTPRILAAARTASRFAAKFPVLIRGGLHDARASLVGTSSPSRKPNSWQNPVINDIHVVGWAGRWLDEEGRARGGFKFGITKTVFRQALLPNLVFVESTSPASRNCGVPRVQVEHERGDTRTESYQ
jgi:hypothetical protein